MFIKSNLALTVPRSNAHPSVFKLNFFLSKYQTKTPCAQEKKHRGQIQGGFLGNRIWYLCT